MKIPGVEVELDTDKLCRYLPAMVATACAALYSISYLTGISWAYTIVAILFTGFSASAYAFSIKPNVEDNLVPLDDIEEGVFEETETSEIMLHNLEDITILVNELSSKQIESSRIQTEDAVTAIIDRFVHLSDSLNALSAEQNLQDDVDMKNLQSLLSDILISFQFQDRTSQILQHVSNSLGMFSDEIKSVQALRKKEGQPEYDKDEIIEKLTKGFTTVEQRAMIGCTSQDQDRDSVEFF